MDASDPRRPREARSFPPQYLAPRAQFTRAYVALWAVAGVLLLVFVVVLIRR